MYIFTILLIGALIREIGESDLKREPRTMNAIDFRDKSLCPFWQILPDDHSVQSTGGMVTEVSL